MKCLLTICLAFTFLLGKAQHHADSLDAYFSLIYEQNRQEIAGLGVSVFSSDSVFFLKGYGYADLESQLPYSPATIQNIGSISKTVIGVALMQAVKKGWVDLDTPINSYLPFEVIHPRFPLAPITLRHLATHTSGIRDRLIRYHLTAYSKGKSPEMSLQKYLESYLAKGGKWNSKKSFTSHAPGSHYEYSNVGAALAAYVLEAATGTSFDQLTQQHIFQPLGITDAGWSYGSIDAKQHATLYRKNGRIKQPYTLVTYPDGGLRTSLQGLTTYFQAIMKGVRGQGAAILEPYQAKWMIQGQFPDSVEVDNNFEKFNYGIFMEIENPQFIGHTGGDPGITTVFFFDPETDLGKILFLNRTPTKQVVQQLGPALKRINAIMESE